MNEGEKRERGSRVSFEVSAFRRTRTHVKESTNPTWADEMPFTPTTHIMATQKDITAPRESSRMALRRRRASRLPEFGEMEGGKRREKTHSHL